MFVTFFLGFEAGGYQLVLLRVAREFSISGGMEGSLVTAQFTSIIIFTFGLGWLSDRIGKKKVLMIFSGTIVVVCTMISLFSQLFVFAAGIFFLGGSYAMCEATAGAAVADAFTGKQEKYMNYVQAFFCLGATAGPPVTDYFLKSGYGWRIVFTMSGAAFAVIFLLLVFTKFDKPVEHPCDANGKQSVKKPRYGLLLKPVLLLLLVSICVYVSVETAVGFFLDYLFTEGLGAQNLSAAAISVFWLSMMLSRFIAGISGKGEKITTPLSFIIIAVFAFLIAVVNNRMLALVCCFVLGFAHGSVWPNLVGMASREYPADTGLITGSMSAASGVGGAFSPVIMSLWADRFSIGSAFILFGFISVAGFLTTMGYLRIKRGKYQ